MSSPSARSRKHASIADKVGAIGMNRSGALLLLLATLVAIAWANIADGAYESFWETRLSIGQQELNQSDLEEFLLGGWLPRTKADGEVPLEW